MLASIPRYRIHPSSHFIHPSQRHFLPRSSRPLSLSAVSGPTEPPLDNRTLPEYFSSIVARHAARPGLLCPMERPRPHAGPSSQNMNVTSHLAWSYDEFDKHIQSLARGLISVGVKKGDRVGVLMGNNSAYAMLQWACASIGAILVTINPAYRIHELVNTLHLSGVSHLFIVPQIRSSSYLSLMGEALPSLRNSTPGSIQEEALPNLKHVFVIDNTGDFKKFENILDDTKWVADFREVMIWREDSAEKRQVQEILRSLNKDDVINLQFTSGTTGLPKAVSLTHHNILNNAISIADAMRLTETDVVCNTPPLFHSRLVLGNLAAWSQGACIVYPSEIFNPSAIVNAVVDFKCTALHGVPTHFLGIFAEMERRTKAGEKLDFSKLRTGIAAGSSIPIEIMKRLIEKLNLRDLTNAYGMKYSPVSFQTTPTDPIIKRVETVGKARPHVKAKIVNPDGNIVPVGTPGELLVSGYLVQKGYWGDDEQTNKVMKCDKDGNIWMHTGDEGVLDEEGYLSIVGRIKDIIIRGGENLFPVQIENALHSHPEILEAAVVSVPDVKYGEVVGAWVIPRPGSEDMTRERVRKVVWDSMNPQNAPAWVWFLGKDGTACELPKTASGKVQKHILREWSRDLAKRGVGLVQ
ncbi:acyl-CoA synthetase [Amylostereum chailletii]|nr:acyl-CoA synthetase [Amylostereum chailletii]